VPSDAPACNLALHPRQAAAYASKATEILYGGAAGGGKSHLLRALAIACCAAIAGLQVYIFRRISEDLVKNHIEGPQGFRAMLAAWVTAKYVEIVEDEIRFWNGAKIYLCHCKDEKDRFKYQGAEIHLLLIDELTTFTEVIYRFLRSRVRMVGMKVPAPWTEVFPRIVSGSNPGNLGHHWVKATFIDGCEPMQVRDMSTVPGEGGMRRQYIPAKLQDNPSMASNDPTYSERLEGLGNPELVRAMRDGDWEVVIGAFFSEWRRDRHVIAPFYPPKDWTVFGALDWGSSRPFSMGWYTVANGEALPDGRLYPRGALIKWREWYGMREGSPNVGIQLTAEALGDGVRARMADFAERGIRCSYIVGDPSMWKEDGGPSIAERARLHMMPADNTRIAGWDQVRSRLVGLDQTPMLFVTSNCVHTIRTLPAVQMDSIRFDDVDTDGEDHAPDEVRYACASRPWARPLVVVPKPRTLATVTFDQFVESHALDKGRRKRI